MSTPKKASRPLTPTLRPVPLASKSQSPCGYVCDSNETDAPSLHSGPQCFKTKCKFYKYIYQDFKIKRNLLHIQLRIGRNLSNTSELSFYLSTCCRKLDFSEEKSICSSGILPRLLQARNKFIFFYFC